MVRVCVGREVGECVGRGIGRVCREMVRGKTVYVCVTLTLKVCT